MTFLVDIHAKSVIFVRMFRHRSILPLLLAGALAVSCSTTRVIPTGKYRLAGSKIKVEGKGIRPADLSSYISQKPNDALFGWSPGVIVYNWADTADTWMNNFIRTLGREPVVFDEEQVQVSMDNMAGHMEYIGWYGSTVRSEVEYKDRKAYVTYYVHPGHRYTISSIQYEVPDSDEFERDFEMDKRRTTVKTGQYLSESALEAETVRSTQFFLNRGYYGFNKNYYVFEADTLRSDGTADLTMRILE